MTTGQKIASLRKQKGWTQLELAEKLQMNANHVSRWEKDKMSPRRKVLQALATLFDVPLHELQPASFPISDDPEFAELVSKVRELNDEHRKALQTILRSMLTCQQIEKVITSGKAA